MSGRYKVKVAIENKLLTVADLERKLKEEYRKTMSDIDKNIGLNKKYTEELKKNKSDFKIKIKKDYSASIKEKISTFLDKVEKFNNSVVFSDLKQEMCEQTKLKTKYLKLANKFKLNSGLNIKTETKNLKEYIQILKNLKKNVKEKVNVNKQKILKYRENYKILVLEKNKVELTIENYVNFEDKISELTNIFESIDKEMACILINDEYEKMSRELKKLKELKQNSIVRKYDDIKNRLIILKDEFEEKKQEVLALKNEIESNLFEINLIKSNQEINDIYSYIEGKDEKIEIFSFAKKYGVKLTNSEEQYSENLIEIQKFLVSYNYDKAFALASQTLKELNQDINLIHSEYERLINEVNYAKNVIKTGAELGYSISAELVEDAIQNGLNIKMTMGDEIVEFAPRINNKGEASLNINHRESVNGNCSGTIRNFILKFKDQGIYIKDDLEKETKKLEKNDGNKLLLNNK